MASQALYRKYRPRTFDEVVGQQHVTRTLRNALASNRVSHAYLFTGPRGTGKTTCARLLAKAVNCGGEGTDKPCGACSICRAVDEGRLIDLIEIDAASNRGIDEIRDLREKVGFRPNEARFKFYIIDEVHMLTEPAFNALLKTLEEPPAHVMFVLATTEPHKIPATIVSRCQRFDFRRIPLNDITAWLGHIADQEGLQVESAALEYIARQGGGSLRDSISLLDQLTAYGSDTITLAQVQTVLGVVASQSVSQLVDFLIADDRAHGLELINQCVWDGTEPRQFTREVVEHLRKLLLLKVGDGSSLLRADTTDEEQATLQAQAQQVSAKWLLRAIRLFNAAVAETRTGFLPQMALELAFLEAAIGDAQPEPPPARPTAETPTAAPRPVAPTPLPPTTPAPAPALVTVREATNDIAKPLVVPSQTGSRMFDILRDNWKSVVLVNLRKVNPMAQGLMNSVHLLGVEGDEVIVEAASDLLKGRVEQPKVREQVEACLSQVVGSPMRLRCVLAGEYRPRPAASPVAAMPSATAPSSSTDADDDMDAALTAPADEPDEDPVAAEVRRLGGVRNQVS
jgi:DNA polymerase-3 subunit gamma/tau